MNKTKLKRVHELFLEFNQHRTSNKNNTGKLSFESVDGQDVYNITAPFVSAGKTVIAGRVEPRDKEHSSVMFFEQKDGSWYPVVDAPVFKLQDPFITFINGELIFGGVEIKEINTTNINKRFEWKTVFYRGTDIFSLTEFFTGPVGMKDIRLCDLNNGNVGVFTRPQGDKGGRGTIGYTEVSSLDELSVEIVDKASLLENMFHPMDWGGVNDTYLLENGEIGLLAHIACYESDDIKQQRHYYAASFKFDPISRQFNSFKIIACRSQFKEGATKRPDLTDVIFSSGLVEDNGKTILYAGVSDAEAHWLEISNPFAQSI
ncbi:MAG: hypothetical protein COB35_08205 [Gammaproteobacteria bacterium]|nr:MAG: hypothetical protein COB35_08205 [Gammaproteobacteria bacterium]